MYLRIPSCTWLAVGAVLFVLIEGGAAVGGNLTAEAAKDGIGRPLTGTEIQILSAIRRGERWSSSEQYVLDPALIRWLCVEAKDEVPEQTGVSIRNVKVTQDLDLSNIDIQFPVSFEKSVFARPVKLKYSALYALRLQECELQLLDAESIITRGDVDLSSSKLIEKCNFRQSKIGGHLRCESATFKGDGIAADISYARIEGNANFAGATISGELDLERSVIGDSLRLHNAKIEASEDSEGSRKDALDGDFLEVVGTIYCVGDFSCRGRFNLTNARVEESFVCDSATFSSSGKGGIAISASGAFFGKNVYFRYGFEAAGTVNLTGAHIEGILGCLDGSFRSPEGNENAINAPRIRVGDSVHFLNDFKCYGTIDFENAEIGKNLDCRSMYEVQFVNGLIPAIYDHQTGKTSDFRCHGLLDLQGAKINGVFRIDSVDSGTDFKLDLRAAKIGFLEDKEASWPKQGCIQLDGLVYNSLEGLPDNLVRLKWIRQQAKDAFRPQPYSQLASVLRSLGDEKSANAVLIARESDPARIRSSGLAEWFWWHVVARYTIGYGYAPWRAFWIGVVLVLVGWLVFHMGFKGPLDERLITPTDSEFLYSAPTPEALSRYPAFNALVFSIDAFTPIVDLRQASRWFPSAGRGRSIFGVTTGGLLRAFAWLFIGAGWILSTLLVVSLTGVIHN